MNRLRSGLAIGALVAVVAVTGQGTMAFGASPPSPGGGEKLVVKDVITDLDGSTHVRYDRTFDGLRVIGGDLVSHRDKAGKVKSVSWNASHEVAVPTTTPKVGVAAAEAAGSRKASSTQKSTSASKGELVVYAGGATPKLA